MQKPDINLPLVASKWGLDADVVPRRLICPRKLKAVVVDMQLKTVPLNRCLQYCKRRILCVGTVEHININVPVDHQV
jgi:hypothetical protein